MRLIMLIFFAFTLTACEHGHGLQLAQGWQAEIIAEWSDELPDMMLLSDDQHTLFITCETKANLLAPSLVRLDLRTQKKEILLYGLARADGLKLDSHGDLWVGEEHPDGLIWRIKNIAQLPIHQRVDRSTLAKSHTSIQAVLAAGKFSHEGLAFSKDGRFLYLADEWVEGCLYRFELTTHKLHVFHRKKGWLHIQQPQNARIEAERLHGRLFPRLEDMETLPDGRILMAETGSNSQAGRILLLDDLSSVPKVEIYLETNVLQHPDNLEWDDTRQILWITDDTSPSHLWAWNGKHLTRIASHDSGEITGVESSKSGDVYINIQHRRFHPDLTLRLIETP